MSFARPNQQNEADETARLLHDVQAPGIVLLEEPFHHGRGGELLSAAWSSILIAGSRWCCQQIQAERG